MALSLLVACAPPERTGARAELVSTSDGRQLIVAGSDSAFVDLSAVLDGSTTTTRWIVLEPPRQCLVACVRDFAEPGMWMAVGMRQELRGGIVTSPERTQGELRIDDDVVSLSFDYLVDGQVRWGYVATGYPFHRD